MFHFCPLVRTETVQNLGGEHSDRPDRPNQHDELRSRSAPEGALAFVVEGPALALFTPQVLDGLMRTSGTFRWFRPNDGTRSGVGESVGARVPPGGGYSQ
jgi:hypothetical protein